MDDKINKEEKKKTVTKPKTFSGVCVSNIKISTKYDWKRGEKVTGLTKKEYNNYKINKIIK